MIICTRKVQSKSYSSDFELNLWVFLRGWVYYNLFCKKVFNIEYENMKLCSGLVSFDVPLILTLIENNFK